jgi:imidazole glycerol phosphate synthase glutamine amidotransferase subunit
MTTRVGVIDYGGGNLRNVLNVLKYLGHEGSLVSGPNDFAGIDRLVFPGVGAFGDCAGELDRRGLRGPLVDWVRSDRPYFGICLGYQVLFESSSECPEVKGLGVFEGEVVRFPLDLGLKVPHMGWNRVDPVDRDFYVWKDAPDPLYLYFVHSFYPRPADHRIIASTTEYGDQFASSIASGNTFAGQFHPERSQEAGLRLMANFLSR